MVEYIELTASDLPELIEFYERYLNSGDYVRKNITDAFERGEYFGMRAVCDGVSAGYFTFVEGFALTYPHPEVESDMIPVLKDRRHVTVDSLMVVQEYRKKGIGHGLCEKVKEQLYSRGFHVFAVEIWVYPDGSSPGRSIYEKMGHSIYKKVIPGFYSEAFKYGISCPVCGQNCRCGACMEVIEI